jgi:hypothetical protein
MVSKFLFVEPLNTLKYQSSYTIANELGGTIIDLLLKWIFITMKLLTDFFQTSTAPENPRAQKVSMYIFFT